MKVVTWVAAVLAAVHLAAGVLVGWFLPLVDGRTARFAIERANDGIDLAKRFRHFPDPVFYEGRVRGADPVYYEWLLTGQSWVNISYTLLVVGTLLAGLAVLGAVLLARSRKAVAA